MHEYEFDPDMEDAYRESFLKSFKKQTENCHFSFIVVDAVFDRAQHVDEFCTAAKVHAYQVDDVTPAITSIGAFTCTFMYFF